jgi:excisionase family DNA binding protein
MEPEVINTPHEWRYGTHVCHLYEAKKDLLDVVVPYFKKGLNTNQLCLWVTAYPLEIDEAEIVADGMTSGHGISRDQIEVIDWNRWYSSNTLDATDLLRHWMAKLKLARAEGFEGIRFAGNMSWLTQETWTSFMEYETLLNRPALRSRSIVLCSYPLSKLSTPGLLDVTAHHHSILPTFSGRWETAGRLGADSIAEFSGYQLNRAETAIQTEEGCEITAEPAVGTRQGTSLPADLVTVGEAAKFLGLSENTIRRWNDDGIILSYRIGPRKDRRFRQRELDRILKEMTTTGESDFVFPGRPHRQRLK